MYSHASTERWSASSGQRTASACTCESTCSKTSSTVSAVNGVYLRGWREITAEIAEVAISAEAAAEISPCEQLKCEASERP